MRAGMEERVLRLVQLRQTAALHALALTKGLVRTASACAFKQKNMHYC